MADPTGSTGTAVGSTGSTADTPAYRGYVLFVLFLVYTLNFIDRQIIGILGVPIKAELGLTDLQMGLMGGLAFALFYTGLGIPIAMLADRFNRTWIVGISLGVWSAFTALCGAATSFWQLFACRVGVGVGEAGGVAPSYSLIADFFPQQERSRAFAVFSFGIPVGSAAGILFGGLMAAHIDWRIAFFVCGIVGVLLAPLLLMTVREPPRGRFDPPTANRQAAPFMTVLLTVARKPSFWLISFGASSSSILGYGLFFWLPPFFIRSHGMTLSEVAWFYSAIVFFGGLVGIFLGGLAGDRFGKADKANYARVPAIAFLLCLPFAALGLLTDSLPLLFVMFLIPTALGLVWLGPVVTAVQNLVPPSQRATASALFLFINNLIGIGVGTPLLGLFSDTLGPLYGADSLRYSILYGLGFYVLAALLMLLASRQLTRDWHE
jgi:MFS family permease